MAKGVKKNVEQKEQLEVAEVKKEIIEDTVEKVDETPTEEATIKEEIKTSNEVILITGEVKLRKFPNLNKSDEVGYANINAKYKIIDKVNNERGRFYKISNGYFIEASNSNVVIL